MTYVSQHEKMYLLTCAPIENSNQHAFSRNLIRVFVFRITNFAALAIQNPLGEDSAQADLNLRWARKV